MTDEERQELILRESGEWAREKLEVLACYANGFVSASKTADRGCFIDGFAGPGLNILKGTGEVFAGSPLVALSAGFRRIHLIDEDAKNCDQLRTIVNRLSPSLPPDTDVFVECGDANERVLTALRSVPAWMPVLIFLDPEKTELRWETLRAIAARRTSKGRKPELLINFPMDFVLLRQLPIGGEPLGAQSITQLFGTEAWAELPSIQERRRGAQRTAETRADLVNFYAERIRDVLGYAYIPHPRPIRVASSTGRPAYYLVFASDHEAGGKIMTHCFGKFSDGQQRLDL